MLELQGFILSFVGKKIFKPSFISKNLVSLGLDFSTNISKNEYILKLFKFIKSELQSCILNCYFDLNSISIKLFKGEILVYHRFVVSIKNMKLSITIKLT